MSEGGACYACGMRTVSACGVRTVSVCIGVCGELVRQGDPSIYPGISIHLSSYIDTQPRSAVCTVARALCIKGTIYNGSVAATFLSVWEEESDSLCCV